MLIHWNTAADVLLKNLLMCLAFRCAFLPLFLSLSFLKRFTVSLRNIFFSLPKREHLQLLSWFLASLLGSIYSTSSRLSFILFFSCSSKDRLSHIHSHSFTRLFSSPNSFSFFSCCCCCCCSFSNRFLYI